MAKISSSTDNELKMDIFSDMEFSASELRTLTNTLGVCLILLSICWIASSIYYCLHTMRYYEDEKTVRKVFCWFEIFLFPGLFSIAAGIFWILSNPSQK